MGDRESAFDLYTRIRGIFSKQQRTNVIPVTFGGRRPETGQSSEALPPELARNPFENSVPERNRGIEGMLRQLFEDLAADD